MSMADVTKARKTNWQGLDRAQVKNLLARYGVPAWDRNFCVEHAEPTMSTNSLADEAGNTYSLRVINQGGGEYDVDLDVTPRPAQIEDDEIRCGNIAQKDAHVRATLEYAVENDPQGEDGESATLGEMLAEIAAVKHAERCDSTCPVHGIQTDDTEPEPYPVGSRVLWTGSAPRNVSQDVDAPGRVTGYQDVAGYGRLYWLTLDDNRHVSVGAAQLKPEPAKPGVDYPRTVTHPNGITQVFRTANADRAMGESAIGAFCRALGRDSLCYHTYNVDGSSLGNYATAGEAYAAVVANDGRYKLANL